ncbi:MAG: hypothetical protein IPI44_03665 [Sulfuritalea sp.]|nr:hypothetical protein [Sulfuritalea sp.]
MKIKSFTKKAICVAVLAGASVGASALTPIRSGLSDKALPRPLSMWSLAAGDF